MTIRDLQAALAHFTRERDWEQFHTPKNLTMALARESGELLEIFQWLTPQQSTQIMQDDAHALQVREEMADILAYLVRLADVLDVDLEQALAQKIEANGRKYPVYLARGRADKYTHLGE
ncbi:nucleotide pyrophosphohydrolase [Streptomyces sp. NPDC002306]